MRGPRYTPEDDARIAELRSQGYTDAQIAVTLGRSTGSIQTRVHSLRMRGEGPVIETRKRPSPLTLEQVGEARAMDADGLTLHQIATRLGSYPQAVRRAVRPPRPDDEPDHARTAVALDEARAALVRAQERHREAMDALTEPVWAAIQAAGLIVDPEGEDVEDGPAWALVDHLRRQGLEIRRVA